MKTLRMISISLFLTTLVMTAAFAEPVTETDTAFGPDRRVENKLQKMQVMLDLTPDQAEQIREVVSNARTETTELRAQKRANREKMRAMRNAESFDETTARELARQQADNQVSMMAHKHATRQQIDAILTPEQREKHTQLRELRQQQKSQRRGERKGGHKGGY